MPNLILVGMPFKDAFRFTNNSGLAKYNLDMIVLTNGWRRYNWQKLNENDFNTEKKFILNESDEY